MTSIEIAKSIVTLAAKPHRKMVVVEFLAAQSGCGVVPDFDIYSVIGGDSSKPIGSTVAIESLRADGMDVLILCDQTPLAAD
jgi:hypothetical protein